MVYMNYYKNYIKRIRRDEWHSIPLIYSLGRQQETNMLKDMV